MRTSSNSADVRIRLQTDCRSVTCVPAIAEAKGCTVAQVALAWLLHQPVVTSVIVGAKRVDQLTDNIAATQCRSTPTI